MNDSAPIFQAREVSVVFGGLTAVDRMSVDLVPGRITGLMGPNGAGKSTFFNTISGHQPVSGGRLTFKGEDVTNTPAYRRARMGIARTFQLGGLVDELTVLENVALGLDHFGRVKRTFRSGRATRAAAIEWLDRARLTDVADQLGADLGAGLRRRAEVARTMASRAPLVLLDEPAAGLTEAERDELANLLREVAAQGTALLVTDHSADFLLSISDDVVVMEFGKKLISGPPDKVKHDPAVIAAYLG